jgi:hypothetical protein
MSLDYRAQLLGADAETRRLDIGRDLVLTRWSKACGITVVLSLIQENKRRLLNLDALVGWYHTVDELKCSL